MTAKHWNMRLPHDETDERKRYVMPDPDVHAEAMHHVRDHLGHGPAWRGALSDEDMARLLTLAEGYLVLTTGYPGQTAMQEKLGDIWRARRAREDSHDDDSR